MSVSGTTPPATAPAAVSSEAKIEIAATPDRVWNLLANIDRWTQWNALVEYAVLSGPMHPGSVFKWKSKGLTIISTLKEVTPNERLTWTGKTFGTHALHSWEIARTNQGVLLRTAESFDGWLPRLLPKTMQRTLDAALPAWLQAIKSEAERDAAAVGLPRRSSSR